MASAVWWTRSWAAALVFFSTMTLALGGASAQINNPLNDPVAATFDRVGASGRLVDQATNLEYRRLSVEGCLNNVISQCDGDPFRTPDEWALRGDQLSVQIPYRYEVILHADLFGPHEEFANENGHPAVVLLPGLASHRWMYRWAAEGLAEAGYVVLLLDPLKHGESQATVPHAYCEKEGWHAEEQEFGLKEDLEPTTTETLIAGDRCAGDFVSPEDFFLGQVPAVLGDTASLQDLYRKTAPSHVFGAIDATNWLLSDANPWRQRINADRLGIAGHSLGAYAAMIVGNGDQRFRTAVALDSFARLDQDVVPRVPTMIQNSEMQNLNGPWVVRPSESYHPARATFDAFREACIPSAFLVLAQSTHNEWQYFRDGEASQKGERVAFYFLRAWLDLYLANGSNGHRWHNQGNAADVARARLVANVFDNSADQSSIGAGAWDPVLGNQPHMIEGDNVATALSRHFTSSQGLGCA